jgi:succinate dehydrogenase flavin-adding protein (antitoxin of CptAB toxin-antitoxin module)
MKELDVLMEPFAAAGLPGVTDAQLPVMERLLQAEDTDLLSWLTEAAAAPDADLAGMVALIVNARALR